MKPVVFPRDETSHDCAVEWWYFNGHLKDKKNNDYSFMNCLFKFKTESIELPIIKKLPFMEKIKKTQLRDVFSAHYIISDINKKKFYPFLDYVVLASRDSFSKPLLFINYASPIIVKGYFNSVIEETNLFEYFMKTENMELKMKSLKKPLLVGKTGFIDFKSKNTYYYSLTNLETSGRIKIGEKWIDVTGKSWMDHQWIYASKLKGLDDKWLWFSIQLDNNTEMVCFEYDDGQNKHYYADISNPDNTQEHTRDVMFKPLEKAWESRKTGERYHTSWKIVIPSKNIDLIVEPYIKNQEMCFGTLNYWEGPLNVRGTFKGKPVSGKGFLESVGRPFQIGNFKFLATSALDIFKTVYHDSRNILGL